LGEASQGPRRSQVPQAEGAPGGGEGGGGGGDGGSGGNPGNPGGGGGKGSLRQITEQEGTSIPSCGSNTQPPNCHTHD
jgi:hypothetical protein